MANHGDRLDENLGALVRPDQSAWEKTKSAIDLAAGLSGVPGLVLAVKGLAVGRAWLFDKKKPDRVLPVLLGFKERIEKLEAERREYLRTDDAQAVLEETFGRIADQPDEARREDMRRILFKMLETPPRDPSENRMFVRLADELPLPALKVLSATSGRVAPMASTKQGLGQHADLQDYDMTFWLKFLVGQGLVDEDQLNNVQHGTYQAILSPLGRLFEDYRRG